MHSINYEKSARELMTSEMYKRLMLIHEYKGKQKVYMKLYDNLLEDFKVSAKVQGMEAISVLNGEFIAAYRVHKIYKNEMKDLTKKELLLYGYKDIISIISNNYHKIFIRQDFIERLYYELKKYIDDSTDNLYRKEEVTCVDVFQNHLTKAKIKFPDMKISEIKPMLRNICLEYMRESAIEEFDNLLLISLFILDFICINPFNPYCIPLSIALFLLLLYQNGYMAGQYISVEKLLIDRIFDSVDIINCSMEGWKNGENNYALFTEHCLEIIISAYEEFFERISLSENKAMSKPDKVKLMIKNNKTDRITKKDIIRLCPDISLSTVEHTLNDLLKTGSIRKVGGGRSTGYIYVGE